MSDQLRLYMLLIPGVVTIGIANLLGEVPVSSGVAQIVLLLFFSFVNIALSLGLTQLFLITTGRSVKLKSLEKNATFLTLVFLIAVLNGFILVLGYENAWLNRAAQKIVGPASGLLTKRTNNPLLHDLLLNAHGRFASFPDLRNGNRFPPEQHKTFLVHAILKDSKFSIVGYSINWDGKDDVASIYLTPACIVQNENAEPVAGSGAYLSVENISYIQFVDENSELARCAFDLRAHPNP
ncbi:MAG: hypothetical protein GY798_26760 [Hyphomicrobiales bacterium]|nr:hypothetical protein [Hyphomicrobiales bacterium]